MKGRKMKAIKNFFFGLCELLDGLLLMVVAAAITLKVLFGIFGQCPKDVEWWIAVAALYVVLCLQQGLAKISCKFEDEDVDGLLLFKKKKDETKNKTIKEQEATVTEAINVDLGEDDDKI